MDKNKALKILGLEPDSTREEAKKVFRVLAKRCHPDRFARDGVGAQKAEARMKEINAAFHFLKALLPPGPQPVRPKTPKTVRRSTFFSGIRERWGKRPGRKSVNPGGARPGAVRPKPPVTPKAGPRFETLLKALAPDTKMGPSTPPEPVKGSRPYENYCRYMAANKRMKGARCRSKAMGIGRVEKISPVRPVNPIGSR